MKILKKNWSYLFLFLAAITALATALQVQKIQSSIPNGILAVSEEFPEQPFALIEAENESPLYKNAAIQKIKQTYYIEVSQKDLLELTPVKSVLSQGGVFWLAAVYILMMLWIWKFSLAYFSVSYLEHRKQKLSQTAGQIWIGILLYLISIRIWDFLMSNMKIPQQYLSPTGVWDIPYFIREILNFYQSTAHMSETLPWIQEIRTASMISIAGYASGFLLFLPYWLKLMLTRKKLRRYYL